ncbi:cell division protein FtsQ [Acidovorax sp. SRB_14]|uniref:cell division protein FtsQ/DivIB n=1 Tax=unclassified Acidovorax TaxID=2684926 RepID=UPI00145F91A8|nr:MULTISPECIES: cell division protein FtsQ/DivIB [unclassified Acidovorax]NMM75937.1 cell division protein FtsQ [Acidovorax sp. SRB_24]NMM81903.1 cell division protein FtsQ [Acidovorax sp. SRB_14]NMM86947.1 cell division protein FtsQ [Rhodococcus sp. SRB_17]
MTDSLPAPLDVKLMNLTASVLFVACAGLALAASAWWLLRHPAFSIGRIVVQGELVHNNAVTLRANVTPQLVGNFFTIHLGAAREVFEQVPWVRSAQVRREFPRTLRVVLQEHHAVAHWGPESGSTLLNSQGEVFDAGGDADQDDLPRLNGPADHSTQVLAMYQQLLPAFGPLGLELEGLEMSSRGGWRATLDSGAVVELGGGTPEEVAQRTQRFVRTLTQVAAQYKRRADALESADLRHTGGYALRLRGVTTVVQGATPAKRR